MCVNQTVTQLHYSGYRSIPVLYMVSLKQADVISKCSVVLRSSLKVAFVFIINQFTSVNPDLPLPLHTPVITCCPLILLKWGTCVLDGQQHTLCQGRQVIQFTIPLEEYSHPERLLIQMLTFQRVYRPSNESL